MVIVRSPARPNRWPGLFDFADTPVRIARTHSNRPMPLYVIPFPTFDPVLISVGPVAIRWYALAYIVGILLGWLYARAIIRSEKLWGGPAPLTGADYDDSSCG